MCSGLGARRSTCIQWIAYLLKCVWRRRRIFTMTRVCVGLSGRAISCKCEMSCPYIFAPSPATGVSCIQSSSSGPSISTVALGQALRSPQAERAAARTRPSAHLLHLNEMFQAISQLTLQSHQKPDTKTHQWHPCTLGCPEHLHLTTSTPFAVSFLNKFTPGGSLAALHLPPPPPALPTRQVRIALEGTDQHLPQRAQELPRTDAHTPEAAQSYFLEQPCSSPLQRSMSFSSHS